MHPLSVLTRRALVAVAALAAVAPNAEAKKKPPLAFVLATAADPQALGGDVLQVTFRAAVTHPASGTTDEFSGSFSFAAQATEEKTRAAAAAVLRAAAAELLAVVGQDVAEDRIAVSLL
jgi:hypothetical protein